MDWRKSSYSMDIKADCVEVAVGSGGVRVRDSKHPGAGALAFRSPGWSAFISGLKGSQGRAAAGRRLG